MGEGEKTKKTHKKQKQDNCQLLHELSEDAFNQMQDGMQKELEAWIQEV